MRSTEACGKERYRNREKEKERKGGGDRERQTDRQTETETETEAEIERDRNRQTDRQKDRGVLKLYHERIWKNSQFRDARTDLTAIIHLPERQ